MPKAPAFRHRATGVRVPDAATMLIFLPNGEQRLISFTLPQESCTLQEVLEQVNVPFNDDTHIQCMQSTDGEIDYFVSVGSTIRIEDILEDHPLVGRRVGKKVQHGTRRFKQERTRSSKNRTTED